MEAVHNLFVYGTLRRGFPLHKYLVRDSIRFLGKGWVPARLYDLGEFPGALQSESSGDRVEGEIYELVEPEAQLAILDEIEEYDPERPDQSLFVRQLTDVELQEGKTLKAWIYFLPKKPPHARLISSGDYAERRSRD